MSSTLLIFGGPANEWITPICLLLASFRVYLQIIDFDFSQLPLIKVFARSEMMKKNMMQIHQWGFYFSVGYILLFAPSILI
jgi:hypothetical protein